MQSLTQEEIIRLKDKKLQLRYIVGGLNSKDYKNCDCYWNCDVQCKRLPVKDDERLQKVIDFIESHHISNETFLRLILTYLNGRFIFYHGDCGTLIKELEYAISDYGFHMMNNQFMENDLKEIELWELIKQSKETGATSLNSLLMKYSLTNIDFIVLAKTSLNYQYMVGNGFEIKDLPVDLVNLLKEYQLYQSFESTLAYRNRLEVEFKDETKKIDGNQKSLVKRIQDSIKKNKN